MAGGRVSPRAGQFRFARAFRTTWLNDQCHPYADWERLPVPQIVKDLLQFAEHRQVPASLERAAEIANRFSRHNLFVLTENLLDWWEGQYFSDNQEQTDSAEMQPQWLWCKALPQVLEVTPALSDLVVINNGRCWFATNVSSELRRGIKNYVRKHRTHEVWT